MGHVGSCSNARLHWSNLALQGNERSSGEYIHGQENSVSFNSVRHNDGAHVHIQQRGGDTTTPTGTQEHRAERNEKERVSGIVSPRHHAPSHVKMRRETCNNGRFTNNQHHEMKRLYNDISTSNIHSCFFICIHAPCSAIHIYLVYIYLYTMKYPKMPKLQARYKFLDGGIKNQAQSMCVPIPTLRLPIIRCREKLFFFFFSSLCIIVEIVVRVLLNIKRMTRRERGLREKKMTK